MKEIFAVMRSADLSVGARTLWVILRSYDSGNGAWPSEQTLMQHLGKTARTVRDYKTELHRKGFLKRRGRGPGMPPAYHPVVPEDRQLIATHVGDEAQLAAGQIETREECDKQNTAGRPAEYFQSERHLIADLDDDRKEDRMMIGAASAEAAKKAEIRQQLIAQHVKTYARLGQAVPSDLFKSDAFEAAVDLEYRRAMSTDPAAA